MLELRGLGKKIALVLVRFWCVWFGENIGEGVKNARICVPLCITESLSVYCMEMLKIQSLDA
ncbi:MAG: hypothetical protein LBG20_03880 [Holosporaceae bacterium]|nr:hypothetical protein [Holosporaceae bacterium]